MERQRATHLEGRWLTNPRKDRKEWDVVDAEVRWCDKERAEVFWSQVKAQSKSINKYEDELNSQKGAKIEGMHVGENIRNVIEEKSNERVLYGLLQENT